MTRNAFSGVRLLGSRWLRSQRTDDMHRKMSLRELLRMFAIVYLCQWGGASLADAPVPPAKSPPPSQLDPITVRAQRIRELNHLDHVVIPQFVRSHAAAGVKLDQIARWSDVICVMTDGLDPEYNEEVTQRIVEIAQQVGAHAKAANQCQRSNVQILFESSPQRALDAIIKKNDSILGVHYRPQLKKLATFNRLIQAWYVTASVDGDGYSVVDLNGPMLNSSDQTLSLLRSGFTSKFANALILVDAIKAGDYSLKAVADYIALVALTKTQVNDSCSELPSIIDLLSAACGDRAKPKGITDADIAFLKALYATDLKLLINMQQGEIHDRMLKNFVKP